MCMLMEITAPLQHEVFLDTSRRLIGRQFGHLLFPTAQLVSPLFVLRAENLVETMSKPRRKQAAYYISQDSHHPTRPEQMRGFKIAGDFNFCFSPFRLLRNPPSFHQS
jgi:hypothetical protein